MKAKLITHDGFEKIIETLPLYYNYDRIIKIASKPPLTSIQYSDTTRTEITERQFRYSGRNDKFIIYKEILPTPLPIPEQELKCKNITNAIMELEL